MSPAAIMAQALALDPASRAEGFAHAYAGLPWRPANAHDWLAYAAGFRDGAAERRLQCARDAA